MILSWNRKNMMNTGIIEITAPAATNPKSIERALFKETTANWIVRFSVPSSTIAKIYSLHCAFAQAVKEGLVGHNPLDAVERPKAETQQFQILTEDEARQFLISASGSPFEAILYLALITGMRKGELLGLKQQGCWFTQQHAAARFFTRAAVYSMGSIPQSDGPSPGGHPGGH
jgi:integrase